jgi:hypothetical protein
MPRKDFDFTVSLFEDFFAQTKIQKSLAVIEERKISGWELWWQIELATFLSGHPGRHEWRREHPIDVDRRKDKEKFKLFADFIIRPKHHARQRYVLIELKQNSSTKTCITNMAKDAVKVWKAKESSLDQRSFWSVGVHPKESKKLVREVVENAANFHSIDLFDV